MNYNYSCQSCGATENKYKVGAWLCKCGSGRVLIDKEATPNVIEVLPGTPIYTDIYENGTHKPIFRVVTSFRTYVVNSCRGGAYLLINLPTNGSGWVPTELLSEGGVFYE